MAEPNHPRFYFDVVLRAWVSQRMCAVLSACPIDVFFTASGTRLPGGSLAGLARAGYLNKDTTKDNLSFEYYVNNHGHRLLKWVHVQQQKDLDPNRI